MKSNLIWKENFRSVVNDDRGHEVVLDLPPVKGGSDAGTTALELCAMSLNGCVGTIFAMMARKSRLEFSQLEVEMEAIKTDEDSTFSKVEFTLKIKTDASQEKVQKCLDLVMQSCPVGVLFRNAGVELNGKIDMF